MSEISVHVKDKHTCGHMHEAIFHMQEASVKGVEHVHYPELKQAEKEFSPPLDMEREHTLEFSGSVERMEVRMCECFVLKPRMSWRRFLDWIKR